MCYDDTARPPLPPIRGGAADIHGERLELTAEDGNRFDAHSAQAAHGSGGPGIVVLPDVRGLHPFYQELVSGAGRTVRRGRGPCHSVGLLRPNGRHG